MKRCLNLLLAFLLTASIVGCNVVTAPPDPNRYGIRDLFAPIQPDQWGGKSIRITEATKIEHLIRYPLTTGGYSESWREVDRSENQIHVSVDDCFGYVRIGSTPNALQYVIEDQEGKLVKHTRLTDSALSTEVLDEAADTAKLIAHLPIPEMPIPLGAGKTETANEIILTVPFAVMTQADAVFLFERLKAPASDDDQNADAMIEFKYGYAPKAGYVDEHYRLIYKAEYLADSGIQVKVTYTLFYHVLQDFSYFRYFTNYAYPLPVSQTGNHFVWEPNVSVVVKTTTADYGYMRFRLNPGYAWIRTYFSDFNLMLFDSQLRIVQKEGDYYVIPEAGYYTLRLSRGGTSTGAQIHADWVETLPAS